MNSNMKPSVPIIWLSVINVIYLMSLPILANITIVPIIYHSTVPTAHAVFWAIFGMLGMPLAFAGMLALNPFPREIKGALMRTFYLPITAGLWWWYQDGTMLEYFTVMLLYEFLAIYLSIFLQSIIPLKYYDPNCPKAGSISNYFGILILHGFIVSGGFITILIISVWPWAKNISYWHHPITYFLLLVAAVEYIISSFRWHKINSHRWDGCDENSQRPVLVDTPQVYIENILMLAPIPWLISFAFID